MSSIVQMTRRVTFSSGHRYWLPALSPEENRAKFGRWASPFNHGHNYVLDVTVEGPVGPEDGMVVNIKRVDDALRSRVLAEFDQRSINDEIPYFANRAPSVENLLGYIADRLGGSMLSVSRDVGGQTDAAVKLTALRLEETPLFYGELDMSTRSVSLTRIYEFAAAHRLNSSQLSDEENVRRYGKCNHPQGHGHNYVLEVTVGGEPDPETGMMVSLDALDETVTAEILDRYDHRNLDVDVEELQGKVTTSEVVSLAIFDRLKTKMPDHLRRIRLWETARNMFEVSA